MIKKIFYFLFAVAFFLISCNRLNSLTGKLYVTGNEPFTQLAILANSGKTYLISKKSKVYFELWNNQNKLVKTFYEKITGDTILINSYELIKGK